MCAVQEKLVRMLGNIQAMYLMVARLTRLQEQGKMTHEMASLVKAWNTLKGREVRVHSLRKGEGCWCRPWCRGRGPDCSHCE